MVSYSVLLSWGYQLIRVYILTANSFLHCTPPPPPNLLATAVNAFFLWCRDFIVGGENAMREGKRI